MGFWDDLNKKIADFLSFQLDLKLTDYGEWIEEKRETDPERFPRPLRKGAPFQWPPKPAPPERQIEWRGPKKGRKRPEVVEVEYDSTGRIISVPEGWEVEFTGTVSGYTGGKGNEVSEERITMYGEPGEITEAELMENYDGKLYWGGSEVLELSSFSERAVEI